MIKDWEKLPHPTERDRERRKNVEKAIYDIEQVAQGQSSNPGWSRSLAVLVLEILRETYRVSRDAESARIGVQAILQSMARDNDEIRKYLKNQPSIHRRGDDPEWPPKAPGTK